MRHDEPDFWWKAKVLPPSSSSARCTLMKLLRLFVVPWYTASKLAPPLPMTLPPTPSPVPVPWGRLPHSATPFHRAITAPVAPG